MAKNVLKLGGAYPLIMNASNEIAVKHYLNKKIKFLDIIKIVKYILQNSKKERINNMEDVYRLDTLTRNKTEQYILEKNGSFKQ